MDLRHLLYFVAVAEEGSMLTAAERRLNTSQANLSRQVRDLEAEVGAALFDRHARGEELTPRRQDLPGPCALGAGPGRRGRPGRPPDGAAGAASASACSRSASRGSPTPCASYARKHQMPKSDCPAIRPRTRAGAPPWRS